MTTDIQRNYRDTGWNRPPRETDMDRFIAAADALAEAVTNEREVVTQDFGMQIALSNAVDVAITEYRAAREAITRGTPPATST